jgi:hypothetical protein
MKKQIQIFLSFMTLICLTTINEIVYSQRVFTQQEDNYLSYKKLFKLEEFEIESFPFDLKHFSNEKIETDFIYNSIEAFKVSEFLLSFCQEKNYFHETRKYNEYLNNSFSSFLYFNTTKNSPALIFKPEEVLLFKRNDEKFKCLSYAKKIKALIIFDSQLSDIDYSILNQFTELEYIEIKLCNTENINVISILKNIFSKKVKYLALLGSQELYNGRTSDIPSISIQEIKQISTKKWPLTHLWIDMVEFEHDENEFVELDKLMPNDSDLEFFIFWK